MGSELCELQCQVWYVVSPVFWKNEFRVCPDEHFLHLFLSRNVDDATRSRLSDITIVCLFVPTELFGPIKLHSVTNMVIMMVIKIPIPMVKNSLLFTKAHFQ